MVTLAPKKPAFLRLIGVEEDKPGEVPLLNMGYCYVDGPEQHGDHIKVQTFGIQNVSEVKT